MRYLEFYEMYKNSIKNNWSVEEVSLVNDINDLSKITVAERHLIQRLVAFFATGDSIVSNNLVLNLYKHINSPEARLYLSRQLAEEANHVDMYLTILDTYIPNHNERAQAFAAIDNIPSIKQKANFCFKWIDSIYNLDKINTIDDKRRFLLNLICFACCIEGLFFYGAFAYVYFLRSKGLFHGLSTATNYIFKDESYHMTFAFKVIEKIREEESELFDNNLIINIKNMIDDAVSCEFTFAEDILSGGVAGLSLSEMRKYLEYIADQRLTSLGIDKVYNAKNPFDFMALQDMQELTNFFERRVSSYQATTDGQVQFDLPF
jgi:ribonucleoside-diphosphate reductase beta chain